MTDEFDPRHTRSGDSRESASSRGSRERSSRHRHRHRHRHDRKERVLHTRISEPLAEDIRRVAEDLRVPVSNLVRNVLEEAFAVVETVSENVGDLIEDIVEEADRTRERIRRHSERTRRHSERTRRHSEESRWQSNGAGRQSEPTRRADTRPEPTAEAAAPRAEYPEVLGWQPLVFNRPQTCSDCEEPIERGERGYVGMVATGLSDIHLCRDCVDARH